MEPINTESVTKRIARLIEDITGKTASKEDIQKVLYEQYRIEKIWGEDFYIHTYGNSI